MTTTTAHRPLPVQEWLYQHRSTLLAILAFGSIFILITPAIWLILTSLKTNRNIFLIPPQVIPAPFTLENYRDALSGGDFPRFLYNSVLTSTVSTTVCVLFSALAAYALTFLRFFGRNIWLAMIVGTQFFPAAILLLPLYRMWADLGLFSTRFSLIASYVAIQLSLCTWLLVGFYRAIPAEILEAAIIDGCTKMGQLWRIVLPLSVPGLLASAAFVFIGVWQEFLLAVTLISNPKLRTVTVGLYSFIGEHRVEWNLLIAASVAISIPTIILFGLVQRYIVDGIMSGALK